ncbi:sugar phosphate isomerase/epimerase family protein [Natranaerofaba carboxydovora]|uniref:sugar phosphate isomerase/epimerase family protein n=1 Tax=Natranaerofaba carboxydovora TaxID=2742683 RepID=UPI001F14089C|nr:sugar phosphate isomerase/epimerase family protein [Natranaerofaba carboxydovora]UMZ75444.1 Xylose isomerase-like TIM barrel [Natranaerofaba carboxydovora]
MKYRNNDFKIGCGIFYERFKEDPDFYLEYFDHLEIQDFVLPINLDERASKIIRFYKKHLKNFKGTLSIHGPFKELFPSSMDKQVRKLAYERFNKGLSIGKELGCDLMVVHSCYNPLMNYTGYRDNWLENSSIFWEEFLNKCNKNDMTIAIENIWDRTPDHLIMLMKNFNTPNLKICFDTGHANLFSYLSQKEWYDNLGEYLGHLHIHDNNGEEDEHLPPGQGNIDFTPLFSLEECKEIAFVGEVQGYTKEGESFIKFFSQ